MIPNWCSNPRPHEWHRGCGGIDHGFETVPARRAHEPASYVHLVWAANRIPIGPDPRNHWPVDHEEGE